MACGEKSCSQRPTEKLLTFQNSREPAAYSLLRMLSPHDQYDANSWRASNSLDFIFCSLGPLRALGLLLADGAPTVHYVHFVKYDVTVSFYDAVSDTIRRRGGDRGIFTEEGVDTVAYFGGNHGFRV